jgi:hypothetical protein
MKKRNGFTLDKGHMWKDGAVPDPKGNRQERRAAKKVMKRKKK